MLKYSEENLVEHMSSRCEDELTRKLVVGEEDYWDFDRTNSPTLARLEDDLKCIRI